MARCNKTHVRKVNGRLVVDEHEYIAGICLQAVSLSTLCYLEATYPDYRSKTYELSRVRSKERTA
jgi:hypothetical protein